MLAEVADWETIQATAPGAVEIPRFPVIASSLATCRTESIGRTERPTSLSVGIPSSRVAPGARLPPEVPTDTASLRVHVLHHARWRERVALEERLEAGPVHPRALRAAIEPPPPRAPDLVPETLQRPEVPGDAVVPAVPPQLEVRAALPLDDRLVSVDPTPERHRSKGRLPRGLIGPQ